jgi:hypothetical protein
MFIFFVSLGFFFIFLYVFKRLKRNNNVYAKLVFFLCFFSFISVIKHAYFVPFLANASKIRSIEGTFKGCIKEREIQHSARLIIDVDGKEMKVFEIDRTLCELAQIGDSIFKIPNDDSVYLIKKDSTIKLQYLEVSDQDYENPLWPKAWQNRWKSYD